MTRTSRLTRAAALAVVLVLGVLGSAATAVWTLTANGNGATRSATLLAPTSVTVDQPTQTSLRVSWSAPANQLPGAISYAVTRSTGGGAATTISCTTSGCTDSGLTAGTTYTYTVVSKLHAWVSTGATGSGSTAAASVATTTTLTSSTNPSVVGQQVTYTATVSATSGTATGNVAFREGSAAIEGCGSQPLDSAGKATCSIRYTSTGSRSITAAFAGSTGFNASSSTALTQTVNKASTATTVSSPTPPAKTGTAVTLTAKVAPVAPSTVAPTGGTVEFKDGGTTIAGCAARALDSAGEATCSATFTTTGVKAITAVYSGDTGYNGSTSGTYSQRVVNGNVAGIGFTNVKVTTKGVLTSVTPTCTGTVGSTYTCTATGDNGGTVTTDFAFINSSGVATSYTAPTDVSSPLSWFTSRNATQNSATIAAGATATTGNPTATVSQNGNSGASITVTFNDGLNSWQAVLRIQ